MDSVLKRTAVFVLSVLVWALLVAAVAHSAINSKRRGNDLSPRLKQPGIPTTPERDFGSR